MPDAPFDLQKAHRWFAVEFNNRAWDLVEAPSRSPDETSEMIHAAHAACIHWRAVGRPVNLLRGEYLLTTAYASAGIAESAVRHAERALQLGETVGDEQTEFDRAALHGSAANAYAAAGDRSRAQDHHCKLAQLMAQLTDADERQLLSKLYPAPAP
jgi:hypothetical protein